jgi:hypothetical protein
MWLNIGNHIDRTKAFAVQNCAMYNLQAADHILCCRTIIKCLAQNIFLKGGSRIEDE